MTAFGNPGWPRFLPSDQRLGRALTSPRGTSPEHLPIWALHAGWDSLWQGKETQQGSEPFPRPPLPVGTLRIPGGFLVPETTTSFSLSQFYVPAWQATDASGHALQVRPGPGGFVEVVVDRPVRDLRVAIGLATWEWGGRAVTGLTAASLLILAFWHRRPLPTPAVAPVAPHVGSR